VLKLSAERTYILWIGSGAMSLDGQRLGEKTILFSDFGEAHDLYGIESGEATCIGLPVPA
jgi:hypothetical protein